MTGKSRPMEPSQAPSSTSTLTDWAVQLRCLGMLGVGISGAGLNTAPEQSYGLPESKQKGWGFVSYQPLEPHAGY